MSNKSRFHRKIREMNKIEIPLGVTCHYERIDGKWYVVWGADFLSDQPGRKLVPDNESLLLEIGFQTACLKDNR